MTKVVTTNQRLEAGRTAYSYASPQPAPGRSDCHFHAAPRGKNENPESAKPMTPPQKIYFENQTRLKVPLQSAARRHAGRHVGVRTSDVASGQHGRTGVRRRAVAAPAPIIRNSLSLNRLHSVLGGVGSGGVLACGVPLDNQERPRIGGTLSRSSSRTCWGGFEGGAQKIYGE